MSAINPTPNGTTVTTDELGHATARPQPKVIAATVGAGLGYAVAEIGIYAFETIANHDVPTSIEAAVGVVVVAALGFVAGYVKKPSPKAS